VPLHSEYSAPVSRAVPLWSPLQHPCCVLADHPGPLKVPPGSPAARDPPDPHRQTQSVRWGPGGLVRGAAAAAAEEGRFLMRGFLVQFWCGKVYGGWCLVVDRQAAWFAHARWIRFCRLARPGGGRPRCSVGRPSAAADAAWSWWAEWVLDASAAHGFRQLPG